MTDPRLYLFDDEVARDWQPFALTRPAGELLFGAHTFRRRAELLFGTPCAGHVAGAWLSGFDEHDAAPVVATDEMAADRPHIFLSSRAVIDWDASLPPVDSAATLRIGDDVVGAIIPAGAPTPADAWFLRPHGAEAPAVLLSGRVLRQVWDLVAENAAQITRDFEAAPDHAHPTAPPGVQLLGDAARLCAGTGAIIEPNVVIDVRDGPVWLANGATVRSFTRLSGPAWIGPGATLLGGACAAISIGPQSKVRGEIEETIVLGYANKAHDGFLGHALLGRWVNLGALTTNSDLKNNYGTIRMWTPSGEVDTGLIKLGCLIGDHAKTGIGALLNTGTVIGAGCNLYGTAMPPKYVPPFSWGSGTELTTYDLAKFLTVAHTVMSRRDVRLTDGVREVLARGWESSRTAAEHGR